MRSVFAYLDAGSASAIISMILGGVAAIGVFLRYRWNQFLRFLRIRKPLEPDHSESAAATADPAARETVGTK